MRIHPISRGVFLGGLVATMVRPTAASPELSSYGRVLERYHAAGMFDGVVGVAFGSRLAYRGAAGLADRERSVPHSIYETFRIASVTKQFTAVLAMQLVERHVLDLDAPIGRYLPTLPPAAGVVTTRQLLKNVSGLPNLDTIAGAYTRDGVPLDDLPAYVASLPIVPLAAEPGTKFSYNNLDFILVGAVLQRIAGTTYATLLQERILDPLKLSSTGLYDREVPAAHVRGYENGGSTLIPETLGRLRNFGPAGSMYSTLADLARWDRSLLRNTILGRSATNEMFTPDKVFGYVGLGSWAYDLKVPGESNAIRVVERQGNIGGIQVLNVLAPAANVSMSIMANTDYADLFNLYSRRGLPYELVCLAVADARTVDVVDERNV